MGMYDTITACGADAQQLWDRVAAVRATLDPVFHDRGEPVPSSGVRVQTKSLGCDLDGYVLLDGLLQRTESDGEPVIEDPLTPAPLQVEGIVLISVAHKPGGCMAHVQIRVWWQRDLTDPHRLALREVAPRLLPSWQNGQSATGSPAATAG
jgi:hypothetical protein